MVGWGGVGMGLGGVGVGWWGRVLCGGLGTVGRVS